MIGSYILMIGISVILLGIGSWAMIRSAMEGRDDDLTRQAKRGARREKEISGRTNTPRAERQNRLQGSDRMKIVFLVIASFFLVGILVGALNGPLDFTDDDENDSDPVIDIVDDYGDDYENGFEYDPDYDYEEEYEDWAWGYLEDGGYFICFAAENYSEHVYSEYQDLEAMTNDIFNSEISSSPGHAIDYDERERARRIEYYDNYGDTVGYIFLAYDSDREEHPHWAVALDGDGLFCNAWHITVEDETWSWDGEDVDGTIYIEYDEDGIPTVFRLEEE